MYYPLAYPADPNAPQDSILINRQVQIVRLVRTQFLKRFESSPHAFATSCTRLLKKLLAFAIKNSESAGEKRRVDQWQIRHNELVEYQKQLSLWGEEEEEAEEDFISAEMLDDAQQLSREEFDVGDILSETFNDLDQVAVFLGELKKFLPKHDAKLATLLNLLKNDPDLKKRKVLIFSEFADTARYLRDQLVKAGLEGVEEIDSASGSDRTDVIRRFAPYYNDSSSGQLAASELNEIRVLISTDILSEGLNLQDATRLINYDLHWNPVRLMQRIGRVDRRMNADVERRMLADHPALKAQRGRIVFWNFLPPAELNRILTLYTRVTHKTLRISKTFGIEGRKLLTQDDDYEDLREFNRSYEPETTRLEAMRLELQELLKSDPTLADRLDALPGRAFSGKQHPQPSTQAVFFCYRIPHADHAARRGELPYTEEAGETKWYLYQFANEKIVEDPAEIVDIIRSTSETPRSCTIAAPTLAEIRARVEKHVKQTRLKQLNAPVGVKPILKAWLELN